MPLARPRSGALTAFGRRAGIGATTVIVSSLLIVMGLHAAPGGPISFLFANQSPSPAAISAMEAHYHLNDPVWMQYLLWLGDAVQGHFGDSVITGQSVTSMISGRLGTTALLLAYASVIILVFGVLFGLLVTFLNSRLVDSAFITVTSVGVAIPGFVAAIVLVLLFAVQLTIFPVYGSGSDLGDQLWHLTLPAVAISIPPSALLARITRASCREEMERKHVQTAVARGLRTPTIAVRHVLRNAMIPISTSFGVTVAELIGGTVIVEQVFGLNGVGSLLIQSVNSRDFPVVQAITLMIVIFFVVVNLLLDVLYVVIDPRLRRISTAALSNA